MKFAFVTCVQIGLSCMKAIYAVGGKIDLIITLNDNKAKSKSGRIYVDDFASENNIPVFKINHINDDESIQKIKEFEIDWLFIIGWSQIASIDVLNATKIGAIGAHPTLLPQGRGRAAIPWAILKNLKKTGVTFFKINKGVDTGLILEQEEILIDNHETAYTLYSKVNLAHASIIKILYPKLVLRKEIASPQDENLASYWPGRKPENGEISLNMKVDEVDRLVRATTKPYPGAFLVNENKKIIIWEGSIIDVNRGHNEVFEISLKDGKYYGTKYDIENIKS